MRQALVPLLLLLAFGAVAAEKWDETPETYFMTREERREWELVKSDGDAARFIAGFQSRRGRDFAAEVRRRAELVDERLALGEAKASTTLRGKIVILLGAPAQVSVKHIPKTSGGVSTGHPLESRKGGSTDGGPKKVPVAAGWIEYTFSYAPNPDLGIGPEGWTVVLEANATSGRDQLKYRRDKKKLDDILDAAARRSIRNHP